MSSDTDLYREYRCVSDAVLAHGMYGRRHGIDIMRDLLVKYGHPERGFRIVHIAGTNGKGSTAYYTAGLLAAAGKTVGLYTSPHLVEVTERICVNGEEIPQEDFVRIAALFCEEKEATASDILLLVALAWFREQNCEYAVMETGLGGAFDSTNALTDADMGGAAAVSIITNIGLDHTTVLGNTLAEIAEAKAGILKQGTRAVLAEMPDEALQVLVRRCEELEIPYTEVGKQTEIDEWLAGRFPELGRTYQKKNVVNAIAAVRELGLVEQALDLASGSVRDGDRTHLQINVGKSVLQVDGDGLFQGINTDSAFWGVAEQGIAETTVPGRLQMLRCDVAETKDTIATEDISETATVAEQNFRRAVYLILDGAHNPQGARALAESLTALYPNEKFDCIVGIVRDKDTVGILEPLIPLMNTATVVAVGEGKRRTDVDGLCRWIAERGISAMVCESVREAVKRQIVNAERKTLAFGSLYLTGEVLKYYTKYK